jgi:hypothetical protein
MHIGFLRRRFAAIVRMREHLVREAGVRILHNGNVVCIVVSASGFE